MSRAEEFIKAKTRIGSNTTKGWRRNGVSIPSYSLPWLTPDQARRAVEIAREEIVEKVTNYLNSKLYDWVQISHFGRREYPDTIMKQDFIYDLKQAIKDE